MTVMNEQERINHLDSLKNNKKFVNKAFWAYNWAIPMNFTRERMLGCSVVSMVARVADDLYPNDVEKQKELCRNHEVFFNTQQGLGAVIYGIILGMELQRARDNQIPNDLIQSVKTALAGPLAGLGDSLIQALITPILISIALGMSAGGSVTGAIFLFVSYTALNSALSYGLFKFGFTSGIQGADVLMNADIKNRAIPALQALGILVTGGVIASISNIQTALVVSFGETVVNIQTDVLDAFFPGLLTLVVAVIVYRLLKYRHMSATKIMLWMIPVGIICYLLKILA